MRGAAKLVVLLMLAGCAAPDVAGAPTPLIAGRVVDEPAVVSVLTRNLFGAGLDGLCTGTIIGPYAVLTAKHCVTGGEVVAPSRVSVYVTGMRINGTPRPVAQILTTPGAALDGPDGTGSYDIAILILDADISSVVAPVGVSFEAPTLGETVTLHGMGGEEERAASGHVSFLLPAIAQLDQDDGLLCNGDSGGPVEDAASGRVIAVNSSVTSCDPGANAFAVRVDLHELLVRRGVGYHPGCGTTEACGNAVDDDCNLLVDEGCSAFGTPCGRDAECTSGMCWVQCTQSCDGGTPCPSGRVCSGGRCAPPVPIACGNGLAEPGETCDVGENNGQYGATCNHDCTGPGPSCGDGHVDAPNETCDDGMLNGQLGRCSVYCALPTSCGDGAVNGLTPCIGTSAPLDACYADCAGDSPYLRACYVNVCTPEACDDGNTISGDGCSAACTIDRDPSAPGAELAPDGGTEGDDDDDGCSIGRAPTQRCDRWFTLGLIAALGIRAGVRHRRRAIRRNRP